MGAFAIFGSGPMAIRKMRTANDLDVIVKKELWHTLLKNHPNAMHKNPPCLKIGSIEIYKEWPTVGHKIDEMIDRADIIAGFPFVQLTYVVAWKRHAKRKKDKKDLALIAQYNGN